MIIIGEENQTNQASIDSQKKANFRQFKTNNIQYNTLGCNPVPSLLTLETFNNQSAY
jgi:hypothetical protein